MHTSFDIFSYPTQSPCTLFFSLSFSHAHTYNLQESTEEYYIEMSAESLHEEAGIRWEINKVDKSDIQGRQRRVCRVIKFIYGE